MDLSPHKYFWGSSFQPQSWTTYGDVQSCCYFQANAPFFFPLILAILHHAFYFPEALGSVSGGNLLRGTITEQDGNVPPGSRGRALLELPAPWQTAPMKVSHYLCLPVPPCSPTLGWFPEGLCICSGSNPYFASSQSPGSEAAAVSPSAPGPTTSSPCPVLEVQLSSCWPSYKNRLFVYGAHYTLRDTVENSLKGMWGPPRLSKSHCW